MKKSLVAAAVIIQLISAQSSYDSLYLKNPAYRQQTALYALSKATSADIVFLGNSITFGANWSELLGRERIVNRGIVSDNTAGMLRRMGFVYRLNPKMCFIMAGINDLYADVPVETVMRNYRAMIDTLLHYGIIPVIQSTLHVNPKWKRAAEKNIEVTVLNNSLQQLCAEKKIDFVDVNAMLSSESVLKPEFTTDGVHLTAAAYGAWRDLLIPILKKHGL